MSTLASTLKEQLDACDWGAIAPHFASGALVLIDGSLDIIEVGVAFSEDKKEQVEKWLSNGKVAKVTDEQFKQWQKTPTKNFEILIVRPFILIRPN